MSVHLVDPSGRRVARAGSRAAAHREARRSRHAGSHLQLVANRASWGGRTVFPREFYIPALARGKTPITIEDLEIHLYETGTGAHGAVVFAGKAQKPLWNYVYKTEKARDQKIADTIASRRGLRRRKATKVAEKRAFVHDFKVGDIVSTSWGWDQTQVEFFQVVEVRGADLIVREIAQRNVDGGGQGSDRVVAVPGDFVGKPIRVRPQSGGGLKVEHHDASKWSGTPKYQTASGWGH